MFIKEPRPGLVKTRLAVAIGDENAARLYERWTSKILEGLQSLRNTTTLIGYYAGDQAAVRRRWSELVDLWSSQPDGGLGDRLAYAFSSRTCNKPAIAIGTDCLDVDAVVVQSAFEMLATSDAVLGPATDGGYYLIGLNRNAAGVFDGIEWSSPQTFRQQRDALQRAGFTVSDLPQLSDIDTIDDWNTYLQRRRQ